MAFWPVNRQGINVKRAVSRDKQGEKSATIRMRTRWWYLSSRATPCLRDTAPAFCLNLAGLTVVTGSAIE